MARIQGRYGPSRRRAAGALIAIAFGSAAGLVVAEVVARLVLGTQVALQFNCAPLSEATFERRHGQDYMQQGVRYTFDGEGFRHTQDIPHDRVVLFVGDSFTEGSGVDADHTFAAATQQSLAARGIHAQSLNAGVRGLGTVHELRLLRYLLDHRPVDAVVFQILPFNDLDDNWVDGGFGVEDGHLVEYSPKRPPAAVSLAGWYCSNPSLQQFALLRLLANAYFPHALAAPLTPATFALERLLLGEARAIARNHGVPIVMAVVGARQECLGLPLPTFAAVMNILHTLDAPALNLCQVAGSDDNFGTLDEHYSESGNAHVGEKLAEQLAALLSR